MLAMLAAVAEIGIHLFLLQDHLMEQPYIGVLFIVGVVILTGVVIALAEPGKTRSGAYLVGGLVTIAMLGSFFASRTIGLPLGYLEGWFTDYGLGIVSLGFEAIFIGCAVAALRAYRRGGEQRVPVAVADREDEALAATIGEPDGARPDGHRHTPVSSDGEPIRLNSARSRR
jgi:hypothetical protein